MQSLVVCIEIMMHDANCASGRVTYQPCIKIQLILGDLMKFNVTLNGVNIRAQHMLGQAGVRLVVQGFSGPLSAFNLRMCENLKIYAGKCR